MQRQKEDIQELTNLFKDMMEDSGLEEEYLERFKKAFKPQPGFKANYKIFIGNKKEPLSLKVNVSELVCSYDSDLNADVVIHTDKNIINDILYGRMTFQRAFMSGEMKMKGDFKILRTLDQIFNFEEK